MPRGRRKTLSSNSLMAGTSVASTVRRVDMCVSPCFGGIARTRSNALLPGSLIGFKPTADLWTGIGQCGSYFVAQNGQALALQLGGGLHGHGLIELGQLVY